MMKFLVVLLGLAVTAHAVHLKSRDFSMKPVVHPKEAAQLEEAPQEPSGPLSQAKGMEAMLMELVAKGDVDGLNSILTVVDETLIPLLKKDVADLQKNLDDAYDKITTGCKTASNTCDSELGALSAAMSSAQTAHNTAVAALDDARSFSVCTSTTLTGTDGAASAATAMTSATTELNAAATKYVTALNNEKTKADELASATARYYAKRGECWTACNSCYTLENENYQNLVNVAKARLPNQQEDLRTYELIKCVATESKGTNNAETLAGCRTAVVDVSSIAYTFKDPVPPDCGTEIVCSAHSLRSGTTGDGSGANSKACTDGIILSAFTHNKCDLKCAAGYEGGTATLECPHASTLGALPTGGALTCTEKVCGCANGSGARGTACPVHGENWCSACDYGYRLEGGQCYLNVCSCDNGSAVSPCPSHGAHRCATCNYYYHVSPSLTCARNSCTCTNGTPNSSCSTHGANDCSSCNSNYFKRPGSSSCEACDNTDYFDTFKVTECRSFARNMWNEGAQINRGNCIKNQRSNTEFCFQSDGNLVQYVHGTAKWRLNAIKENWGSSVRFSIQHDDNLVVYDGGNSPVWASGTNGRSSSDPNILVVQNDCNVVLYDASYSALWSTGNTC